MSVFRLRMLPASEGDCLILSYGSTEDLLRHVIIDGGRKATWPSLKLAVEEIAAKGESVELLLLSHIDADHIDGLVELVESPELPIVPKAVWYNGYEQLVSMTPANKLDAFGFKAADAYSKALSAKGWSLNDTFKGQAIFVEDIPEAFEFAGLKLTLLSPSRAKLDRLRKNWVKALKPSQPQRLSSHGGLEAFGKRGMPAELDVEKLSKASLIDTAAPNGSSIAMLAEYGGRTVLLGADAHPDIVADRLKVIAGDAGRLKVDLVKLPHHGSRANITKDVLDLLDCSRFAISTNGAVFGHPDPEAVSRVLKFGPKGPKRLYFNYATAYTSPWNDDLLKRRYSYDCVYPASENEGLVVDI